MVPNIQKCLFRNFSNECLTKCVISNHVKCHENVHIERTKNSTNKLIKNYESEKKRFHIMKKISVTFKSMIDAIRFKKKF